MKGCVLVTGGTGFVGSHVVETYLAAGWTVRALVRDANRLQWLTGLKIEIAPGTLTDTSSLEMAVRDCDTVVHCAAMTKAVHSKDLFEVNSDAVAEFVKASRASGVKRFILVSSQAAAGPSPNGEAVTENMPPHPISDYGRSKLQGEQSLKDHAGAMEWVVLRPPTVIGPRDEQMIPLFRGVVRWGLYPQFGNGRQRYSFVSVHDLARALLVAGEIDSGLNEVYFVSNSNVLEWKTAAMQIAGLAKRRVRSLNLGRTSLRILSACAEAKAALTGKPALLSFEKIREILSPNWLCSGEKIRSAWGFESEWPQERILRETFEAYSAAHWI